MARTGRPRLPIEELKRRGTYRKDRHGEREAAVVIPPGLPSPPANMAKPVRAVWDQLIELLAPLKILRATDAQGLATLCDYIVSHRGLCAARDKHPAGSTDYNRIQKVIDGVSKQKEKYEIHFGLLPDIRNRIKVPKDDKPGVDPKKALFANRTGVVGKIGGATA